MPDIVGIRFKPCGKVYDFEVDGLEVQRGDSVVVESEFGLSIGTVVREKAPAGSQEQSYKRVLRRTSEDDIRTREENKKLDAEAGAFCMERIMARGLPMKFVGAESTLDRKRIVFFFTAEGRIDFRELVKDLAARFRTRIEMRQIGIRDEAKLLGGIGICGRQLCCATFLTHFAPISIKMAKKQDLALNVGKLSGLCSRLMCCLRYEHHNAPEGEEQVEEMALAEDDAPVDSVEGRLSAILPAREGHGIAAGSEGEDAAQSDEDQERTGGPSGAQKGQDQQTTEEKKARHRKKRRRFRK